MQPPLPLHLLLPLALLPLTTATDTDHHRSKRYFFINPDAPITLGFLLNMPISLALPTLVDTSGRSLQDTEASERALGKEFPEDLYWEPSYEEELSRLQVYFSYLQVASVECQEQLVCEIAASPSTYSPLSELVLKELRQSHGPVKASQDSLLWRYMAASATGYAYHSCGEYYPSCGHPAAQSFNMAVLKVWQFLATKLDLKLV